ncbi:MAG: ABC transporter permease [Actinomycetota bacterium]|nr:ABC transporter permease [Actinomycetota bacterium]
MTRTDTTAAPARALAGRSALRVGLRRGYIEIRQFLRERDAVVFSLGFPVGMMILFASIFHGKIGNTGVDFRQVFISGMIASGIMSTSFQSLAISIAQERDDGTLKRLAGTPMPRAAYFIGKVVLVVVTGTFETVLLLAIGTAFFGLHLPASGARWLTLIWVFGLSMVACSLLGIAMSSVPRSGRAAAAVVTPPFILLQFISGVYFLFSALPRGLQQVAAVFPLKWMTQGLRSVFLPDTFTGQEAAHSWEHGKMALVLLAWCVGGLVLCLRTFRWKGRRDG